ncbi:hypothetical protein [uncultured Roseibium sp.]|uniref:hypothetical protein n=1 Tax=uncultured Roseibium sp. TaxID=1936171 RepID=UPI00262E3111|nr:hypothetical protein [uncultured Roseibium sp.]
MLGDDNVSQTCGNSCQVFLILFSSSYFAVAEEDDRSVRIQSSVVFGALEATATNVIGNSPGRWALTQRWVGASSPYEYGEILVSENEDSLYRLCRVGATTAGTGTSELFVYANNSELRGYPSTRYSLDISSFILVEAKHLALRYSENDVTLSDFFWGSITKIDKDFLRAFKVEKVSNWSMTWEKKQGSHHNVILTKDVPGSYQFCLDSSVIGPPTNGKYPNSVVVRLLVDNKYIKGFNKVAEYALSGCTFFPDQISKFS